VETSLSSQPGCKSLTAAEWIVSFSFSLAQLTAAPPDVNSVQNEESNNSESKVDDFQHYNSPLAVHNR